MAAAKPGGGPRHDRAASHDVAHRLRGPLNSLMLWSDVLQHHLRDATPPVQRALSGLRRAILEQARLIEALLERPRSTPTAASRPAANADRPRTP